MKGYFSLLVKNSCLLDRNGEFKDYNKKVRTNTDFFLTKFVGWFRLHKTQHFAAAQHAGSYGSGVFAQFAEFDRRVLVYEL